MSETVEWFLGLAGLIVSLAFALLWVKPPETKNWVDIAFHIPFEILRVGLITLVTFSALFVAAGIVWSVFNPNPIVILLFLMGALLAWLISWSN